MVDRKADLEAAATRRAAERDERAQRLAQELRANLGRRKSQARGRVVESAAPAKPGQG